MNTIKNKYAGMCHGCQCEVKSNAGILESKSVYSRGRLKNKSIVWCKSCFDKSDHSSHEDRACGDRAYEDACERACNY